jgi:membrane protein implicated in regulation of membrane protease activity
MYANEQPPRNRGSALGMMLTVLAVGFFLLVLILISGGFFLYVVQIAAGVCLVTLFHYVLWGRTLSQSVAGEREEEQLRQRAAAPEDWPAEHPHGIRRP